MSRPPDPEPSRTRAFSLSSALRSVASWNGLLPALIVTILCTPCLGLGYFWDDYSFLTFKGGAPSVFLLPDPQAAFYRPVTQSLYFLVLRTFEDGSEILGHVVNLVALIVSVALVVLLVSTLRGRRAGLAAGLVLATFGHIPSLVAWVSCNQDLFAMAFVLAALWLRQERRDIAALACTTAALFSKEPALTFLPVLVFWDHLVGRKPTRVGFHLARYGGVALLWAVLHPGFQTLLLRGFRSGATGYVGLGDFTGGLEHLRRYVWTLLNLPAAGLATPWPTDRTLFGVLALVALLLGLRLLVRESRDRVRPVSMGRIAWIAVWTAVPAILLHAFLVRHWASYYATTATIGVSILLGSLLATFRPMLAIPLLALFLVSGIWCRGVFYGDQVAWSERSFQLAASAAREVEANFKRLYPSLPPESQVLVSVTQTGFRGVSSTLLEGNALQVWYQDPRLRTVRPESYRDGAAADVLVRVTSRLAVVGIDPDRMRVQWSGEGTPDPSEINRPIRAYARGLAAAGHSERAIRILRDLARIDWAQERPYDHRLVAMVLLADGRRKDAEAILDTTAAYPQRLAIEIVQKLLTEPTRSAALDSCAFEAFGLSPSDPEVQRRLARRP